MKKKFFLLMLVCVVLATVSCRNQYEIPTYQYTDSYGSVFEGRYVPQDSH